VILTTGAPGSELTSASDLLNGSNEIETTDAGEFAFEIEFSSGVDASEEFEATISAASTRISEDANASDTFSVDTTADDTGESDIVVAADGSDDYTSIQNAVGNATPGDRIKVESGTYEQHTEITKNITLYAPQGATIANNSVASRSGFQIFGDVTPTISGFTLTDWQWGVSAGASDGSWTVKDVTINGGSCSVCAAGTPGDWTLKNADINNGDTAISGYQSSGDWQVVNTSIEGDISAAESSGSPSLQNTTIVGADQGVDFGDSIGSLSVIESKITDSKYSGIEAENVSGDVDVVDTTIRNSDTGIDFEAEASGDLTVDSTIIQNITYSALDAENATRNINVTDTTLAEADMGIDLEDSTADLQVDSTTIQNITYDGIQAEDTTGDLNIQDLDVQDVAVGIDAIRSDGQVSVTNAVVEDTSYDSIAGSDATGDWTIQTSTFTDANGSSKSIELSGSEGTWQIQESLLVDGVNAQNAARKANASYNNWGASDGPDGDFAGSGGDALGNVTVNPYYADLSLTQLDTVQEDNNRTNNAPPTAQFTYQPPTPTNGTEATFNASDSTDTDGSISSYAWDLNSDGNIESSKQTATFTYDSPGEYQVNLTVTDNDGATNTTSQAITVEVVDDGDTTVPKQLKGDVTATQYAAVLNDDDSLSASNLADAINSWSANGHVNGIEIGAFELSELINYWADE
jgi:pectinesterase